MKIIIEKHAIEAVMRRVISVVEKRNTIQILSNVMIETDGDGIKVQVSNSDMEATDRANCQVIEPGSITVEASKLYDIVRGFQAGAQVQISTADDDPRLVVLSGRSRFRLPMLSVTDFPVLTLTDWPTRITLPAKQLNAMLAKSTYSASNEAVKYILTGTYFHSIDGGIRCVGTNGKRLAQSDIGDINAGDFSALIPPRMTAEMMRRLADEDGDVDVCVSESRIALVAGHSVVSSKLIDGTYVNYARTIPAKNNIKAVVDADALAASIRSILLVSEEKTRGVRLSFSTGSLVLSGRGPDADARDELETNYEGEPLSFAVNGDFVLEILSAFDGDTVEISMADEKTPTVWRKTGDDSSLAALGGLVGVV